MLTPAEMRHYEAFGFVILRSLFTPQELTALEAEFEEKLDRMVRVLRGAAARMHSAES
jgi:hypothetical protein